MVATRNSIFGALVLLLGACQGEKKKNTNDNVIRPDEIACIATKESDTSFRIRFEGATPPFTLRTPFGALTVGGLNTIIDVPTSAAKTGTLTFTDKNGVSDRCSYDISGGGGGGGSSDGFTFTSEPIQPRITKAENNYGQAALVTFVGKDGTPPYQFSDFAISRGRFAEWPHKISDTTYAALVVFTEVGTQTITASVKDKSGIIRTGAAEIYVREPAIDLSGVNRTTANLGEEIRITIASRGFINDSAKQCSVPEIAGVEIITSGPGSCGVVTVKSSTPNEARITIYAEETGSGDRAEWTAPLLKWQAGPSQRVNCTASFSGSNFITSGNILGGVDERTYPLAVSGTRNGQNVPLRIEALYLPNNGFWTGSSQSPQIGWTTAGTKTVQVKAYVDSNVASQREYCGTDGWISTAVAPVVKAAVACNLSFSQSSVQTGQEVGMRVNHTSNTGIGGFEMVDPSNALPIGAHVVDSSRNDDDKLSYQVIFDYVGKYNGISGKIRDLGDNSREQSCSNSITITQAPPTTPSCTVLTYRDWVLSDVAMARIHDPISVCAQCPNVINPDLYIESFGGSIYHIGHPIDRRSEHEVCMGNIVYLPLSDGQPTAGQRQIRLIVAHPWYVNVAPANRSVTIHHNFNLEPALGCAINGPTQATIVREQEYVGTSLVRSLDLPVTLTLDTERAVYPIEHGYNTNSPNGVILTAITNSQSLPINVSSQHGIHTITDRVYDYHDDIPALGCSVSKQVKILSQIKKTVSATGSYDHCVVRLTNTTGKPQKITFWVPTASGDITKIVVVPASSTDWLVTTNGIGTGSEYLFPKTTFNFDGTGGAENKCRIQATLDNADANYVPVPGEVQLKVRPHKSDHHGAGSYVTTRFP